VGTRNITSVIMNGKQVVCQYGQWDGYPSWTGAKILEFLRNANMDQFKRALENTTIAVVDYEKAVSYTGSTKDYSTMSGTIDEAKRTLSDRNGKWPDLSEVYEYLVSEGKYTEDDLENYFAWTRDTGCDILPLIYDRPTDKPPFELSAMTDDYNGAYAWDIQGIYVLNLDHNSLKMTFDDYSCEFDLNHLPEEIDKTMLVFEKATSKMYEYRNFDFSGMLAAGEGNNQSKILQNMAADIAVSIGEEIKEEYPDLISDTQQPIQAKEYGQDLVYRFLCEKAGLQMDRLDEKLKAADQQIAIPADQSNRTKQPDGPMKDYEP